MHEGLHQYWCPSLPSYVPSPEHLWVAFGTSPGASCRWCGRLANNRSRDAVCPGRATIGMR